MDPVFPKRDEIPKTHTDIIKTNSQTLIDFVRIGLGTQKERNHTPTPFTMERGNNHGKNGRKKTNHVAELILIWWVVLKTCNMFGCILSILAYGFDSLTRILSGVLYHLFRTYE
jgi:hypothetical protein